MRLFRTPFLTRLFYPEALFRVKAEDKILYLTFDDGPDSLSTIPLLNTLSRFNAKACFFCKGKAAFEHQGIIEKIRSSGHLLGNHTYDHPDGFYMTDELYLKDVEAASEYTSARLFRPPYGRLRRSQYNDIKKSFSIIMWDVMPYDFDPEFRGSRALKVLKRLIRPGSIIVLHDTSESTWPEFLEDFLSFASKKGYRFDIPLNPDWYSVIF